MGRLTLEEAYSAWADDLVRYAAVLVAPSDAPDVVADAFARLLSNGQSWARADEPRRFLFGVVANVARDHHRSAARRQVRATKVAAFVPNIAIDELDGAERDHILAPVLAELSPQQRAVVYLTYWEDMSVADVANTLGVSDGSVRRQLARGRERLRRLLP